MTYDASFVSIMQKSMIGGAYVLLYTFMLLFTFIFTLALINIGLRIRMLKIEGRLFDQALEYIGFYSSANTETLHGFHLASEYKLKKHKTYQSKIPRPYTLHHFTIVYEFAARKIPFLFLGFIFTMKDRHPSVLICDRRHTIQGAAAQRLLESSEFERAFHVYSNDPKAPFYFLDPDTISDLIDIHTHSTHPIHIDVVEKQLLVAVSIGDLQERLFKTLSIKEKLTGRISEKNAAELRKEFEVMIHTAHRVFHSLDYPIHQR